MKVRKKADAICMLLQRLAHLLRAMQWMTIHNQKNLALTLTLQATQKSSMTVASKRCVNSLKYNLPRLVIVAHQIKRESACPYLAQPVSAPAAHKNNLLGSQNGHRSRRPNEFRLSHLLPNDKSQDTRFLTTARLLLGLAHMLDVVVFVA